MKTLERTASVVGGLVAPALIALAALAIGPSAPGPAPATIQTDTSAMPECGHDMGNDIDSRDSLFNPGSGQLTLSDPITNIPEFHDCQRLIVTGDQGLRYDSIFAVFGAWDTGPRWDSVVAHSGAAAAPVDTVIPGQTATTQPNLVQGALQAPSFQGVAASTTPLSATIAPTRQEQGSPQSPSATGAWGFVEVYAEGAYSPLGIGPGFNCLFLYFGPPIPSDTLAEPVLQSRMVGFGRKEPNCAAPADPDSLRGTILQIRRTQTSSFPWFGGDDYPAAARWHWNATDTLQYIGFKCGQAWCEASPGGFTPSMTPNVSATEVSNWSLLHRVYRIKGWFDEQQLAPAQGVSPVAPAPVRGTVFPDPGLDARLKHDFANRWVPVARITLDAPQVGYETKLNLYPVGSRSASDMNRVDLCWGTWRGCRRWPSWWIGVFGLPGPPPAPACGPDPQDRKELPADKGYWWARVTSAPLPGTAVVGSASGVGGLVAAKRVTQYYCVRRRDHAKELTAFPANVYTDIPAGVPAADYLRPRGTVRWRWRANDEWIWISCDAGCCVVEISAGE